MKPLATSVLGGMVRSLALVLIVTPAIFHWLKERELQQTELRGGVQELSNQAQPARESADYAKVE